MGRVMDVAELLPYLQLAVVMAFVASALVAVLRVRQFGPAGRWVAAAFVALAAALAGVWGPEAFGLEVPEAMELTAFVLLLAFPYLLLRFAATFRQLPTWMEVAAGIGVVVSVALVLFGSGQIVVWVGLGYWVAVSSVTVVRLWRAGRGQPTVARRRMRMMSVATAAAAIAVLLAFELSDMSMWVDVAVVVMGLGSSVTFGIGFAPPRGVRLSWRQPEERLLQAGTVAVMSATTVDEVAAALLPPTVRIVGASGAVLLDPDGKVIAVHGQTPALGAHLSQDSDGDWTDAQHRVVSLGEGRGQMVVWTSPYTPFFGPEEVGLLNTMAVVAGLSLERCQRLEQERERRRAVEQARREAERAREEADKANAAKSEFLSRMSHELRTPLNAILGFGQLLETSDLDAEDEEGVEHIMKAGRHLLALINDVLDLSRIEAGKLTVSPEAVHAGELIDDTVSLIRPQATERDIRVMVDGAPCDSYVITDRQRCRQVLLNLLSNAVKYNHDGGSVEVSCHQPHDQTMRISVRDTGSGIAPDQQAQLFEPFERLGADTTSVEGTGLGLALTKQLVERLGGVIGVESVPGDGSTFWIDLPVTHQPTEPDVAPAREGDPATAGDTRTLLLVEDNLANLKVVEAMLRRRPDVCVLPAMQGGLALELASRHRPDVIVLDLHLPDLPGREVLKRLQADPRTRDIPVVVVSADATRRRAQQLRDDGAFDYLAKPLDLHEFLDVVDAALTAQTP